jgi:SAM-dependent methyltransferase
MVREYVGIARMNQDSAHGRTIRHTGGMTIDEARSQRKLGSGAYRALTLRYYDLGVLRLSCRLLWRCPSRVVLDLYQRNVTANHLEAGVGTGYFLDNVAFPSPDPRLMLVDLAEPSLRYAARRLARYRPETRQVDVLAPFPEPPAPFDSIGLNFLLHCLPGPVSRKAAAFDTLSGVLKPGGVIFGSTLLTRGKTVPFQARAWMRFYNSMGVFDNGDDTLDDLRAALEARFDDASVEMRGALAIFCARGR